MPCSPAGSISNRHISLLKMIRSSAHATPFPRQFRGPVEKGSKALGLWVGVAGREKEQESLVLSQRLEGEDEEGKPVVGGVRGVCQRSGIKSSGELKLEAERNMDHWGTPTEV